MLQGEGSGILPGYKKTKVIIQMLKEDSDQHDQLIFLQEGACYRSLVGFLCVNILCLHSHLQCVKSFCMISLCSVIPEKCFLFQ